MQIATPAPGRTRAMNKTDNTLRPKAESAAKAESAISLYKYTEADVFACADSTCKHYNYPFIHTEANNIHRRAEWHADCPRIVRPPTYAQWSGEERAVFDKRVARVMFCRGDMFHVDDGYKNIMKY